MKSIINTLFIVGALFTPIFGAMEFMGASNETMIAETHLSTDTIVSYSRINEKIDSIDIEINHVYEKAAFEISNNRQVLQNKKKELLQLAICLDSVSSNGNMEITSSPICDSIANN